VLEQTELVAVVVVVVVARAVEILELPEAVLDYQEKDLQESEVLVEMMHMALPAEVVVVVVVLVETINIIMLVAAIMVVAVLVHMGPTLALVA